MTKLQSKNTAIWMRRSYRECGPHQWVRELLMNAFEAKATRMEFGIEWQAVKHLGVYRRVIMDDGEGMTGEELKEFFSNLNWGSKQIGGTHDNFGVGAKISLLPWNPEGVVVISYKNGKGSAIWIHEDEDGDPNMAVWPTPKTEWTAPEDMQIVGEEEIAWDKIRPPWITDHGTIVVLMGSDEYPHTMLGDEGAGEGSGKHELMRYLNARFWDMPLDVAVSYVLHPEDPTLWPSSAKERNRNGTELLHPRTVEGLSHVWVNYTKPKDVQTGQLKSSGTVLLDNNRVKAHWYLWEGKRPDARWSTNLGMVATKYRRELYGVASGAVFRSFGIPSKTLQDNLCIILEPQECNSTATSWGVYPDGSRNRLLLAGAKKGESLPLSEWGKEFAKRCPPEIREAILASRLDSPDALKDLSFKQQIQQQLSDRFRQMGLVMSRRKGGGVSGTPSGDLVPVVTDSSGGNGARNNKRTRTRQPASKNARSAVSGGTGSAERKELPPEVPDRDFVKAELFETYGAPYNLIAFDPNYQLERGGTGPCVLINLESPLFTETVLHYQKRWPAMDEELVREKVMECLANLACAKIAHSQIISHFDPTLSQDSLNEKYRSPEALTIALMGTLAETLFIESRLAGMGMKKG